MKITKTEKVKMSWDSFTFPITVGTPVSNGGVLADSASAYGLIVRTIFAKPDADETAEIMTGGVIDMEEVSAGYGKELSSEAVQALCGIHFYKNGVCIPTGGSGGGSDDQKWHETTSDVLFSETVATADNGVAQFNYSDFIDVEELTVTFDGVEYVCPKIATQEGNVYGGLANGAPDFSKIPFAIASEPNSNSIIVETPGTHTVSASVVETVYTEKFSNAVRELSALVETDTYTDADFCVIEFNNEQVTYFDPGTRSTMRFYCTSSNGAGCEIVTSDLPTFTGTMMLTRSADGTFVGDYGRGAS